MKNVTSAATVAAPEAASLPIMCTELRLPTIKRLWQDVAEQSNREGWPAERFLGMLLGHEMAERETRRLERARASSQLPPGKSLSEFDFSAVPTAVRWRLRHQVAQGGTEVTRSVKICTSFPAGG